MYFRMLDKFNFKMKDKIWIPQKTMNKCLERDDENYGIFRLEDQLYISAVEYYKEN